MLTTYQLHEFLDQANLSTVAKHTGISRQTLSALRNNKDSRPSYATLEKLSNYFQSLGKGE